MGEHVGEDQYPTSSHVMHGAAEAGRPSCWCSRCRVHENTAPGGGPFIESYIAPDMHMRPLWQTVKFVQDGGFEVRHVEAMREHYVRTAEHWLATPRGRLRPIRRAAGRGGGPGLAALPRRRRAGIRAGPDGRRPDPGSQVVGCTDGQRKVQLWNRFRCHRRDRHPRSRRGRRPWPPRIRRRADHGDEAVLQAGLRTDHRRRRGRRTTGSATPRPWCSPSTRRPCPGIRPTPSRT